MIDRSSLSGLIREILAEELSAMRGSGAFADTTPTPQVREEVVSIRSNAELMAFVKRILDVSKDGKSRQEIESGRWIFSLGGSAGVLHSAGPSPELTQGKAGPQPYVQPAAPPQGAGVVSIASGLVSERQIDSLPAETSVIKLSGRATLTPLARDRARQQGIAIERSK